MFGLVGFAECDTDGCLSTANLQLGLTPGHILRFDATQLVPEGWQMLLVDGVLKLYCPTCVEKQQLEARREKLTVVSS